MCIKPFFLSTTAFRHFSPDLQVTPKNANKGITFKRTSFWWWKNKNMLYSSSCCGWKKKWLWSLVLSFLWEEDRHFWSLSCHYGAVLLFSVSIPFPKKRHKRKANQIATNDTQSQFKMLHGVNHLCKVIGRKRHAHYFAI